jgi:hypothetical protein
VSTDTDRPISLAKARKARDRARKAAEADANAAKFGRTKAQKLREAADKDRARRQLDSHRIDPEGRSDGGK